MFSMINRPQAAGIAAALSVGLAGYHLLILSGALSSQHVWLGRIATERDLLMHESVSLGLLFVLLVALALDYLGRMPRVTRPLFLFFALLFSANALVNLFAPTWQEQLFGPLALFMALLMYRLSHKETFA